jgi:hypothetical protein
VLDITGNQLPVATDTASQVDEVVRVTDGANTLANLLSLPSETLLRLARCLHLLLGLLQTRSQGGLHQGAPSVLIPCLGRLLQQDIVADRLNGYQAKATGKGFILCRRDILRHHSLRQALCLLSAVGHDRFFHTQVDPLLRSIGGTHKSIEPRHLPKETDQPNATRTDFDKYPM